MTSLDDAVRARTPLVLLEAHLDDITPVEDRFLTVRERIRLDLLARDIALVTYSLADGVRAHVDGIPPERARPVTEAVRQHGLTTQNGLATTLPALIGFLRDAPVRVAVLVQHAERSLARVQDLALLSEEQLRMRELVADYGNALPPRRTGNMLILTARPGALDPAIEEAATPIRLPLPDAEEKQRVFAIGMHRYPAAHLALPVATAARLTAGTSNLATEGILRHSDATGTPITAAVLCRERHAAIRAHSEGILTQADLAAPAPLAGDYLTYARRELQAVCAGLAHDDPDTEPLVVVHGPPGIGKTELVKEVAADAAIPVYELHSLENQYVGESQRRSRRFHELRCQPAFVPNLILADELRHITTRREAHDSGVTAALHQDWLAALADQRYRGRSVIVGTTNVPHRLPTAFQSRCLFLPVFAPSRVDLHAVLTSLLTQAGLPVVAAVIDEAAAVLHAAGASPRDLARLVRRHARAAPPEDDLLQAAHDLLVPEASWQATRYCDYWSLQTMTTRAALPWRHREEMPAHLAAVIDDAGRITHDTVRARLRELDHVQV